MKVYYSTLKLVTLLKKLKAATAGLQLAAPALMQGFILQ